VHGTVVVAGVGGIAVVGHAVVDEPVVTAAYDGADVVGAGYVMVVTGVDVEAAGVDAG
jgi:hypothetical protein